MNSVSSSNAVNLQVVQENNRVILQIKAIILRKTVTADTRDIRQPGFSKTL